MLRIELDDPSRPPVPALLAQSALTSPSGLPWNGELLLGCAALKELSSTGEIKSMRTPGGAMRCRPQTSATSHLLEGVFLGVSARNRN